MDIIDIYQEQNYKYKKEAKKELKEEEKEGKEGKEKEEEEYKEYKEEEEEDEIVMDEVLLKLLYNKSMNQVDTNITEYESCKEKKQNKIKKIKKNIITQENVTTMYQRKFNPRFPPYNLK